MRPSSRTTTTPWSILTLFALVPSSWAFDCSEVLAQSVKFDLHELGGPHVVHWTENDSFHDMRYNYNFTVDICNKLKWHKDGSYATECHHGAQVCAIREDVNLQTDNTTITPIDIAGTYPSHSTNRVLDAKFSLLRNSKSNSDAGREGVRIELHGGKFPWDDKKKGVNQQAIIEFVCDKERSGLGGDEKDGGEHEPDKEEQEEQRKTRRDVGGAKCEDTDADLRFCGYALEDGGKDKSEVQTLRLEWRTKYACEDMPPEEGSTHWGFFTWFIIILFLAIAAYLIFGSWLNYNRYGARGWDLLPHGDTIRDIPYIMKDFGRKVVQTVQGSGSRGGYSAV